MAEGGEGMSNSTDKTSCLRHRAKTRFFVFYEDLQDISRAAGKKHMDKVAAHLRVLETKTNDRETYNEQLIEDARKQGLPLPETSLWIEIPYSEFVRRSLHTFERSSFQVAEKEAQKLLFSKSRVQQRHRVPNDPDSPLEDYKEYILVRENVQAALDGKEEMPITGIVFDCYPRPVLNVTPPVIFNSPPTKNNSSHVENNSPPVLNSTAPPVKNNTLKNLEESSKDEEKNNEEEGTALDAQTPPALIDFEAKKAESDARLKAVTPPVPSWDEVDADVLKTTVKRQAVKGDANAATSVARPGVAGISGNLPAHPGRMRDSGSADLVAYPAVSLAPAPPPTGDMVQRPATSAQALPLTHTPVRGVPSSLSQDGAAAPTVADTPPASNTSESRASGETPPVSKTETGAPPLSLQGDTPRSMSRKQQDRLIAQTFAAYWLVIEAWKGQKYSQTQRAQACHTSGLEAMYADGVTPDALTAKLKLLDDFQQRTFNVNRLYLEWWNNLDEAQPAKTNGKVSRGKPAPIERDAPVLAATGTDDLSAYGHSGFDVYKGNGPEERRRLAEIGAALPESYWE